MLTAVTSSGNIVEARHVQRGSDIWRCPECHDAVVLKQGRIVTHHFAHTSNTSCSISKGESELHRRCKIELFDLMSRDPRVHKPKLERGLGEVRPDFSAYINRMPVAIEVQVSNLSVDEIIRRTVVYHSKNIAVLWLSMWRDKLSGEYFSPRPWEKWLHAAQFGRVYYWKPGYGLTVDSFQFLPFELYVEESEWDGEIRGGYWYVSKRWKRPMPGPRLHLINDFTSTLRDKWSGGKVSIPICKLFIGRNKP